MRRLVDVETLVKDMLGARNMDAAEVLEKIQSEDVIFLDFWFVDIFGELKRMGMPNYAINEDSFRYGLEKLDASSIRGFKSVNKSDMILKPDPNTFNILPPEYNNGRQKNARIICDLYEGDTGAGSHYNRDSRGIAKRAVAKLEGTGITHTNWGPKWSSLYLMP